MADPLLGQRLGPYRITRLLKRTGMSMVYLARDDKLERDVVVKVMLPSHSNDEAFAARFHQEALATARLGHPNIIHIYDFGRRDDLYYMVIEYLPGGSLYDRLVKARAAGQRVDMAEALHIVSLMGQALDHAHRAGFVHRDVKPSNILFSQDGHPVLTDLGVVTAREGPAFMDSQLSAGTPAYMSPEQGQGDPVDARSDVYALGVVLYELLGGALPFQAETTEGLIYKHLHEAPPPLQMLNRAVSPALRSVVEKALAKRPEDRFQSAQEMVGALERAQSTPGRRLYPPSPPPPLPDSNGVTPKSDGDKTHRGPQLNVDRTDVMAIPVRVTSRPATTHSRSAKPWLLGIAVVLLVGAVTLITRRTVNPSRTHLAVATTPQTTASFSPMTVPITTRTPVSPKSAPMYTATSVVARVATPSRTPLHVIATATVASPQTFPTVVLSTADGLKVILVPYLDPHGQYGLYVPENWLRTADSLGVSFEAPDRMARVLVHQIAAGPDESGAAITQRYVEGARALFQEIREVESAVSLVGRSSVYEQLLEAEVLNVPVKVRLLAVNTGKTGLIAVAAASAANEPAYRSLLSAVLDSFRVSGSLVPPVAQDSSITAQSSHSPTIAPTFTLAPAASRLPATATRPAMQPTATQTSAPLIPPILISPADNESLTDQAMFSWRWAGPALAAGQGFEVRIWKEGQSVHYGAASPTDGPSLTIHLPAAYGVVQGGSGTYFWTVAVVQRSPYKQIGPEAAPRRLQVQVGGDSSEGGDVKK